MKYSIIFCISLVSILFATSVNAQSQPSSHREVTHKRYVQKTLSDLYMKKDITLYDRQWSPNVRIYASGGILMNKAEYRDLLNKSLSMTDISIREIGAEGDWVFVHSSYMVSGVEYAIFDLIQLQDSTIIEHWIIRQPVPTTSLNTNTMFSSVPMYRRTPLAVEKRNRNLAVRSYQKLFGDLDITVLEKYWHPDYIQHNPLAATGRDALRDFLVNFGILNGEKSTLAFDLVIADGNLVVTKTVMNFGGPAIVVDMFRMERGQIREHWDVIESKK